MFFIIGTRYKDKPLTETPSSELCMNCGEKSKHIIVRERKYFTFFFIPLIPLHTRYVFKCPACTYSRKITRAEAKDYCNGTGMLDSGLAYSDN